jgi:hypothetical protein
MKCFTLHKKLAESAAPLLTGDEDTEPIAVIVETGAQS